MEQWTEAELRAYAPRGRDDYLQVLASPSAWQDMQRAEINTPARVCRFISQWSEETDGLSAEIVENTNWSFKNCVDNWPDHFGPKASKRSINTARFATCRGAEDKANLIYGSIVECGNSESGDGYTYRGRGLNQITGRKAYRNNGERLGIDLENHPDLAANPAISLRIAILEWTDCGCNKFADRNNGRAIGNAINRGNPYSSRDPIGYERREKEFERAWAIWGSGAPGAGATGIDKGDSGSQVELLQRKLAELGYQVGRPDGVFGPVLARAVVAFKHDYTEAHADAALDPGSLVDAATWAAIDNADPIQHSEERTGATEKELAEAGSTTVTEAQRAKRIGTILTGGGIAGGAAETGALDGAGEAMKTVTQNVEVINQTRHTFEPLAASIHWIWAHALWVFPIGFGIWLYAGGTKQIASYVEKVRSGHILWR